MLKLLNAREKTILYLTVGVIIFSLAFNLFLAPLLGKAASLNREVAFNKARLNKYVRLLGLKDYLESKYRKLAPGFQISGGAADPLVGALAELEGIAKDANIRIIDLRPENTSRGTGSYREILIGLRAEGNMEGYLKFLYNLENSLSLLKIRKFQLNARPANQLLEGTFTISQLSTSSG